MNNALKDEQGRDRRSDALYALLNGEWPTGYFHWNDRWYFARQPDGSVHVIKIGVVQHEGLNFSTEAIIPPNEWVSIIAHVAKGGEAENYTKAVALHNG